jgi:hypothetical protein
LQKLQSLPELPRHLKYLPKSAKSFVEVLSEKEAFREAYFSSYIDEMSTRFIIEASTEPEHQLSEQEIRKRASLRYDQLFNVDINLIIHAPSVHDAKAQAAKAPVVAALQVGDYVYEWNKAGLVVPMEYRQVATRPLLLSPVNLTESDWCSKIDKMKDKAQESIEKSMDEGDYSMQIQLHFDLTEKRDELLNKFILTVLDFNRHKEFSSMWCNNHHFLKAAMKSLGIRKPPKLSVNIAGHIGSLRPSKAISRKQINNHQELDAVVSELDNGNLSRADIEFLIAKYFLYHVADWEREPPSEEEWECALPNCRQQKLTEELGERTSISSDN